MERAQTIYCLTFFVDYEINKDYLTDKDGRIVDWRPTLTDHENEAAG